MSKVFYDTEFLEGTQKGTFTNTPPTIDLISIGMVREDGAEYYAISKEFNLKEAWNRYDLVDAPTEEGVFTQCKIYWIRENVLKPLYKDLLEREGTYGKTYHPDLMDWNYRGLKNLIKWHGKTNRQIAQEVKEFCTGDQLSIEEAKHYNVQHNPVELYGYYSAYDHVALCWLFGKMIDLPKGFPRYTRDLKQIYDEKDKGKVTRMKDYANYPKEENAHSAIHDARWNYKLYEFLMNTK